METQNTKTFIQILKNSGAIGAVIFIFFFFGSQYLNKFDSLQKDLLQIKMELTKIQSEMMTEEKVKTMIDQKARQLEYHYHNQQQQQ